MISPARSSVSERREDLKAFVRAKVGRWQRDLLMDDAQSQRRATAARDLAELRRVPVDATSIDFGTLLATMDGFPPSLVGRGDEIGRAERAAHAALVLFALHQQSQRSPVHVSPKSETVTGSVTLGHAASRLARSGADLDEGVLRRFKAVAGAATVDEALYHLGAFVALLRSASPPISLDYGQLAADIDDLHSMRGRERVQLSWARAFHAVPVEATAISPFTPERGAPA